MGFSGPGPGRPKGSKNKRTDLHAICEAKGLNVFEEMLTIAMTTTDPDKRFGMFRDIAPYLHAKKREVEYTLQDYSDEDFDKEVQRRMDERRAPAKVSER